MPTRQLILKVTLRNINVIFNLRCRRIICFQRACKPIAKSHKVVTQQIPDKKREKIMNSCFKLNGYFISIKYI